MLNTAYEEDARPPVLIRPYCRIDDTAIYFVPGRDTRTAYLRAHGVARMSQSRSLRDEEIVPP